MLRGAAAAGLMMHTEKVTGMAQILPLAPRARPVIFSGEERKAREKMPWLPIYQFNLHQALMGTLNSLSSPSSVRLLPAVAAPAQLRGELELLEYMAMHRPSSSCCSTPRDSLETSTRAAREGDPAHAPQNSQTRRFPNQGLLSDRDRKVL